MQSDEAKRKAMVLGVVVLCLIASGFVAFYTGAVVPAEHWIYEQATAKLPIDDPDYMYNRALAYDREGNSAFAFAAARRAVIIEPAYAPARKFLAAQDLKNHDFSDAALQCKGLLSTKADDSAALLGLATAYNGMGQSAKSEAIYQQVMDNEAAAEPARNAARKGLEALRLKTAAAPAATQSSP